MTETQTPENHRRPLAPGEIRTHTVGVQTFRVMHVAGGSFTQAGVRTSGAPSRVLCTDRFADVAVNAYADAIEQAESDAIDALDGDAEPIEPLTAEGAEALRVRSGWPQDRSADGVPEVEQASAPAPVLADDVAELRAEIADTWNLNDFRAELLARVDRIAARAPQRATATGLDLPLWLHVACGGTHASHTVPKLTICRKCDVLTGEADWRALYVLPDGA